MSPLSIIHLAGSLLSVIVAMFIFGLRKGTSQHRILGWIYVVSLFVSLVGIIIRTWTLQHPFTMYAIFTCAVLLTAVIAVRQRHRIETWRSWHAALMSLTALGSFMAIGSIVAGVAVGAGNGPAFYRAFNVVIIAFTIVGLWFINTRPVIWGRQMKAGDRTARIRFNLLVIATSSLLVCAQLSMAQY